jgi:tetratricopeptide (TPR) repeat protein
MIKLNFGLLADENPTAVIGYTKRAAVYLQQKKFAEAEKDLNKVLLLDPKYVQGYLQRGSLFRQICRYASDIDEVSDLLMCLGLKDLLKIEFYQSLAQCLLHRFENSFYCRACYF